MSDSLAALEADAEQWYRLNMLKPIAAKNAFVDEVTALYAPPFTYLDLDGEIPLSDAKSTRDFIQGFSDWLDESPDWTAEVIEIQTKALNDSAMILIADWCLRDSDGKPITDSEIAQYFYILSRQTGEWKVVGEATVSAKKRIHIT